MTVERNYWTTKTDYRAECHDCSWSADGRNGLAIAAKHHDKTSHTVFVDILRTVVYETKERELAWG